MCAFVLKSQLESPCEGDCRPELCVQTGQGSSGPLAEAPEGGVGREARAGWLCGHWWGFGQKWKSSVGQLPAKPARGTFWVLKLLTLFKGTLKSIGDRRVKHFKLTFPLIGRSSQWRAWNQRKGIVCTSRGCWTGGPGRQMLRSGKVRFRWRDSRLGTGVWAWI